MRYDESRTNVNITSNKRSESNALSRLGADQHTVSNVSNYRSEDKYTNGTRNSKLPSRLLKALFHKHNHGQSQGRTQGGVWG